MQLRTAALEVLAEEAKDNPMAQLYGKRDVLPLDTWVPRHMDATQKAMYSQMVDMTEPQLEHLRTWVY